MAGTKTFADTNVVLYLLSSDNRKAETAQAVLAGKPVISVQVLNEFTSVARRKLSMRWSDIEDVLDTVQAICKVESLTYETHQTARAIAQRYKLNFYDGLIAASAILAGCTQLLSEDMQSGLLMERQLRVINPFTG